jgi:hypothetical protein
MSKKRAKKSKPTRVTLKGEDMLSHAISEASKRIADDIKRLALYPEKRANEYIWTTAFGDRLPVSKMDEGHLRNTISFLQRKLVFQFGQSTYLQRTKPLLEAMLAMLSEAQRRGIEV